MGKHTLQIPSADGCVYVYDVDTQTVKKVCDIVAAKEIPADVWETIKAAKLAVAIKDIACKEK
jgi:hypothetical protein